MRRPEASNCSSWWSVIHGRGKGRFPATIHHHPNHVSFWAGWDFLETSRGVANIILRMFVVHRNRWHLYCSVPHPCSDPPPVCVSLRHVWCFIMQQGMLQKSGNRKLGRTGWWEQVSIKGAHFIGSLYFICPVPLVHVIVLPSPLISQSPDHCDGMSSCNGGPPPDTFPSPEKISVNPLQGPA